MTDNLSSSIDLNRAPIYYSLNMQDSLLPQFTCIKVKAAQDPPQASDQDLTSCMHSLRGGVGSNMQLYEPEVILSLHLSRSLEVKYIPEFQAVPVTVDRYSTARYHSMASV